MGNGNNDIEQGYSNEADHDVRSPELMDMPRPIRMSIFSLGLLLVVVSILMIVLDPLKLSWLISAEKVDPTSLMLIGILIFVMLYFPWQKLSFMGLEIERAENIVDDVISDYSLKIEDLISDYSFKIMEREDEISQLKMELEKYKGSLNRGDSPQKPDIKTSKEWKYTQSSDTTKNELKQKLIEFLSQWSSYGFTISRIRNWGGKRRGYDIFKNKSTSDLRRAADELVREKKARTRISSNGNLLYQIK